MTRRETLPAGLRRSVALAVLREAGDDGVTVHQLEAALGADIGPVIEELRDRGHCIATRPVDPGRITLHTARAAR